jgi:hypothetical protein
VFRLLVSDAVCGLLIVWAQTPERKGAMSDGPLDMLVVRDMPDGTFAIADALQGVRIVQDGFKSRAEAEKVYRGLLFGRWHHRATRPQQALIRAKGAITGGTAFRNAGASRTGKCCLNHLL